MLWFLFFTLKVVAEDNTNRKDKVSGIVHVVAVLVKLDALYHNIYWLNVSAFITSVLKIDVMTIQMLPWYLKMMFIAIISKSIVTVIKCSYYSKCGV